MSRPIIKDIENPRLVERFPVRAASHALIRIDRPATNKSELFLEYFRKGKLLATERRPLESGTTAIDVKTSPAATHVTCELVVRQEPVANVKFEVRTGNDIQPISRHFMVIGAMKAGTTTLFKLLERHPQLCRTWVEIPGRSFNKEINYFNTLYRKRHSPINYDWRFPFDPSRHSWTLDVSPNYAKLPGTKNVAGRITQLGAQIKIAYLLREPVDRIESQIAHSLMHKGEQGSLTHAVRVSKYALHLDNFTKKIPRKNILLIDFDQLRRKPSVVMAEVCDFLGIERLSAPSRVYNRRGVDFQLTDAQRLDFANRLRPDVRRLISEYGFAPAEKWLNDRKKPWFRMPLSRGQ